MIRGVVLVGCLLFGLNVYSATSLNFQGRILRPDGTPVTSNNVQFKIQIRSPNSEDCLLYEELHVLDMTSSSGIFSIAVGSGARSAAGIDGGYSFDRIFANRGSMDFSATVPSACLLGTTYAPTLADQRKLTYSFNEGTGWQVIPSTAINWTPLAIEALQIGGYKSSNLLRVADATGTPQSAPTLLPTDVTELVALLAGTSTRYVQPSSTATFSSTITFGSAPQFSGTPSSANDLTNKTYVDAAISTGVAAGLPNVGTAGTYFKVATDTKGRVTSGAASLVAADIPSLDASKVTTGTFGGAVGINTSGNIYSSGTVTGGTVSATTLKIYNGANFLQVSASSMSGNLNWILPNSNGSAGQVLRTDGAGNLSWVAASSGSVTGVTATPPLAAGTGATPNITIVQATTSTDGYLSSTDFNTFNSKLGASSTFAGDVSGVSTSTAVDKLKGIALSISALTSGNFLKYNGANWINASLSNTDITSGLGYAPVNKAGDTMTGLMTLSADPSAALGAATKQYVDASTTTAAANYIRKDGTVAFTAAQSLGSNKLTFVADPTVAQDAATKNYADTKILSKTATAPAAGQDGQSLRWNENNTTWEYYTAAAAFGYAPVNRAGDTMTGALISSAGTAAAPSVGVGATTLGLFNAGTNILGFSTAGTERMRIDASGNIGIGTATPTSKLNIESTMVPSSNGDLFQGLSTLNIQPTTVTTGIRANIYAVTTVPGTNTQPIDDIRGLFAYSTASGSGSISSIYGGRFYSEYGGSVTASNVIGALNGAGTSAGTASNLMGTKSIALNYGGNITAMTGVMIETDHFSGTLANRYGIYLKTPSGTATASDYGIFQQGTQKNYFAGNVGIGTSLPTAVLNLKAGTTAASTAPLKFTSGPLLTAPEAGAVEYDGANMYFTDSGAVRRTIASLTSLGSYLPLAGGTMTGAVVSSAGTAAAPSVGVGSTSMGLYSAGTDILGFSTAGTEKMRILASGNVGIGTTPTAKLTVAGAANSVPNIISSGANVDLSLSNVHLLQSVGGSVIALSNIASGASYTLVISDTAQQTYTFTGCTNSYFSPTNGQTFQQSTFSILAIVNGGSTNCYINWVTGFN